jgi:hypothetical protein
VLQASREADVVKLLEYAQRLARVLKRTYLVACLMVRGGKPVIEMRAAWQVEEVLGGLKAGLVRSHSPMTLTHLQICRRDVTHDAGQEIGLLQLRPGVFLPGALVGTQGLLESIGNRVGPSKRIQATR